MCSDPLACIHAPASGRWAALGPWKWCCYEHGRVRFCVSPCFQFGGAYSEEWNCWVIWLAFEDPPNCPPQKQNPLFVSEHPGAGAGGGQQAGRSWGLVWADLWATAEFQSATWLPNQRPDWLSEGQSVGMRETARGSPKLTSVPSPPGILLLPTGRRETSPCFPRAAKHPQPAGKVPV